MITCQIMGGLGNQLFQIFATIAYAIKHNEQFTFLYSPLSVGVTKRVTYWDSFLFPLKSCTSTHKLLDVAYIKEQRYEYDPLQPPININNVLLGYFQSPYYFKEASSIICEMIRIDIQKNLIKKKFNTLSYDNLTSMHFRLGDYKVLQDCHPVMKYEYYRNSIQHIMNKTNNDALTILYFCEKEDNNDVLITIKKLINAFPKCAFLKADDTIADWKQMLLMSCCRNNIVANSSFSWWGAYFNSTSDKIVCYPNTWFGPKKTETVVDLFPDDWTKITDE